MSKSTKSVWACVEAHVVIRLQKIIIRSSNKLLRSKWKYHAKGIKQTFVCRCQRNGKNLSNSLKYKSNFFLCMMMQQCCSAIIQLTLEIKDTTKLKKTYNHHILHYVFDAQFHFNCNIWLNSNWRISIEEQHYWLWTCLQFFLLFLSAFFNCYGMPYDTMCATI